MPLTAIEFHQMTGRAGRRGRDNIGFALMIPGRFMDLKHIAKLVNSLPSSINSQIRINFSMVLNLLLALSLDQIQTLLRQSFARFQHQHAHQDGQEAEADLWESLLDQVDFLKETGYAGESGRLTEDGRWASQLRVDQPLMIAEGFRLGIFPESDPALLAAIIASFVNERQTDDPDRRPEGVPKKLRSAFSRVRHQLAPFIKHMTRRGFAPSELHFAPAITIYKWCTGIPWEAVVREAGIEEGDLANLVFRTADNLRHIASLKHVFPKQAQAASEAVGMIMKEPLV
jgi:ATP-dependent RNA helicase HelY